MSMLRPSALVFAALFMAACGQEETCSAGACEEETNDRTADPSEDTDTDIADTDTGDTDTTESTFPDLVGNTYFLDVADGNFVSPPGVGPLIQQQLETGAMFLGVTRATASEIEFIGAVFDEDTNAQDMCSETVTFADPGDFTQNPSFSIDDASADVQVEGINYTIESAMLTGTFSPDESQILNVIVGGVMDTRPLVPLIGGGNPNDVCDLVMTFGVSCVPCPDGTGSFCLQVQVDSLQGELVPSVTIVEVTEADVLADPACDGEGGFACSTTGLLLAVSPFLWLLSAGFIRRRQKRL